MHRSNLGTTEPIDSKTEAGNTLNGAQKNIIEGTLFLIFDELFNELSRNKAVKALKAMISDIISHDEIKELKQQSLWREYVEPVRSILIHDCPENRSDSYPYVGQVEGFCMYKIERSLIKSYNPAGDAELLNGRIIEKINIVRNDTTRDDYIIAKERQGLLSLTAREDKFTPPVNKEHVVSYIHQLVNQEIIKNEERPIVDDAVPVDKSDIEFRFIKAYHANGVDILNSMYSYQYEVMRPDIIRFKMAFIYAKNKEKIYNKFAKLTDKCSRFQSPMSYSSESGKTEIEAKDAVIFLNALVSLKLEFRSDFILGQIGFNQLIADLYENKYLTTSEREYYLENTPVELTLEEREGLAKQNQDFKEAIELIKIYKNQNDIFSAYKIITWLTYAVEFKPEHVDLNQHMNLDDLFLSFKNISCDGIFQQKGAEAIIEALKRNETISTMSFGYFNPKCVNRYLADYLAETQTLKCLNISAGAYPKSRLKDTHMDYIGYGLQFNTSLEELDITGQSIGDDGLIILLEALSKNPNTKLKTLMLAENGITDKGAKELIKFLQDNHSLEFINLYNNRVISKENLEIIFDLCKQNNHCHSEEENKLEANKITPSKKCILTPISMKQMLLPNLGKRLHVGEHLLARDVDWVRLFDEAITPYAHLKLIIKYINQHFSDQIKFDVVLEHDKELNLDSSYGKGVYLRGSGSIISRDQNVNFSVNTSSYKQFYLSENASVLQIKITQLSVRNQEQLDIKLQEAFVVIKHVTEQMFTNGIYREDTKIGCTSWLTDKNELSNRMDAFAKSSKTVGEILKTEFSNEMSAISRSKKRKLQEINDAENITNCESTQDNQLDLMEEDPVASNLSFNQAIPTAMTPANITNDRNETLYDALLNTQGDLSLYNTPYNMFPAAPNNDDVSTENLYNALEQLYGCSGDNNNNNNNNNNNMQ